MKRLWSPLRLGALGGLALLGAACTTTPMTGPDGSTQQDMAMAPVVVAKHSSRSSTVAIADDDSVVVMTNPDDGSLSTFKTTDNTLIAKVPTGKEPGAVVIHPNNTTAFVANRADGTVVKVSSISSAGAAVSGTVGVGSEPTGLALSPTGALLFVANWAEGTVSVVDTATMSVKQTLSTGLRNPRAVAVTNNLDTSDSDETLVVTEFYGEIVDGKEAKDDGRVGRVHLFNVGTLTDQGSIAFNPMAGADTGFMVNAASPNQLASVAINGKLIYVTSVSASPEPPVAFNRNVNPIVYVGDLSSKQEVRGGNGTTNLARRVSEDIPADPKFFLADLADIAFVPGLSVAYAVARGADVVQRIDYSDPTKVTIGSTMNKQIDVLGTAPKQCLNPTGIAIANTSQKAYLNCWVSRRLGVLDLSNQVLADAVVSTDVPAAGTPDASVLNGKRFYFTGRGRWSSKAWSSCGSCHPDGLSDNITWIFNAGPRQTISMDGTFSKGAGTQLPRVLNYTAIFDEIHDFENNTRGVSGGLGAITTAPTLANCGGDLSGEVQVSLVAAGLGTPTSREANNAVVAGMVNCNHNWDDIENFVKTIRPPKGRRGLDLQAVARGAALFGTTGNGGSCVKCHGTPGWTVSHRAFSPSTAVNVALTTVTRFAKPSVWPSTYTFHDGGFQIEAQQTAAEVAGFNAAVIPPLQVSCVLRNVNTFGIKGDTASTDALEIKNGAAAPFARAQGRGGYSVPSLYGLSVGAPYLHHGQAKTLTELLTDARFSDHTKSGTANFPVGATDVADLVSFLLSIDETTTVQTPPDGFAAGCSM